MKHIINEILSGFKNLKEYSEFMQELSEKSTSGEEVARGMSKNDKSKQQKKDQVQTFLTKDVKKHANGSSTEKHYGQVDPSIGEEQVPEEPPVPLQPGQQVTIGRKQINKNGIKPKTTQIEISGQQDKLDMTPRLKKDPKLQT